MTLLLLAEASKRRGRAALEHQRAISKKQGGRVLGQLASAIEHQHVSVEDVVRLISEIQSPENDPPVLSFVVLMDELEQHEGIPLEEDDDNYPALCDWLELDLVRHLRSIMKYSFHYTQPSERWGDGLSVRIVFLGTDWSGLERFDRPWWEIQESAPFSEIFECSYEEAFPYELTQEYFGQLESRDLE